MFNSNQILSVSGEFNQLKDCLEFALKMYGEKTDNLVFQLAKNGKFCIGWGNRKGKNGNEHIWQNFQFGFDINIATEAIKKFLQEQPRQESVFDYGDGSTSDGFLMKIIPETFAEVYEGIKEPFYGIVSFEKYTNYYGK